MEKGVGKRIINVLIFTIPSISIVLGEPKMNDRLVMDVNINIKTVGEHMMIIVLMAPPSGAEAQYELAKYYVE